MNSIVKKSYAGDKVAYAEYLRGDRGWDKTLYTDPDTTHIMGVKSEFYQWLERYLNDMEAKYLNGKWKYTLVAASKDNITPSGIKVCSDDNTVMYLRSDQFGFSAPQGADKSRAWDDRYPYGKYVTLTQECDLVADVIWDTRSQGGSFIWPIYKCESESKISWSSQYNMARGVRSYIEDRVDITLWEIKRFYEYLEQVTQDGIADTDILIKKMNESGAILLSGKDNELITELLIHFETFDTYVKFFAFDSFMKEVSNDIINLITGEKLTEAYITDVCNSISNRIVSIQDSSVIKGMLLRLQNQTNCRTDEMIKRVCKNEIR